MNQRLLRCIVCVVCIHLAKSIGPGFKARVTDKGLKYANDAAIQALSGAVEKTTIPDQHGSDSGFKYSVTNIHVTQFMKPTSDISIAIGQGLTWTASNAYIAIHGDFHYKKWIISGRGSFDAKVSAIGFNLGINIGTDTTGRPTLAVRSCSSSIGNVDFKFYGGMAWLYNLFRRKIGNVVKSVLNKQMCLLVTKEINEDGNKKLAKIKVTTPLARKFLLDYRLIKSPLFVSAYMETYHKGEIFWLADPSTESPVVPSPMADSSDTQSMLYLFMSDYMFNTIGDVAQRHGFLAHNLSSKDLPASNRGVLNTTCHGFKCIGKLIPQIGRNYPNSVVDLLMNSTVAPTLKITPSGVYVYCSGSITLYARNDHQSGAYLLSLNALMMTTAKLWIQNELLYAKIGDLSLNLTVTNSSVGQLDDKFLDFLINEALNLYLIPNLNELGSKGFPFPVTDEIKFVNTALIFAQNTILISTDLNYIPSEETEGTINDDLTFVPKISRL